MNWYKTSQEWYTEEVAQNTKDSNILIDILQKGNDDWVSRCAASNPNCPPKILAEVLNRGNNDAVSCFAAENPNCPPEALANVLKSGNNESVSSYAAENPNCPPELLKNILNKGKDDLVSRGAALNPNCPPEALAEVLKRGNNDLVSCYASQNPKCPPLERVLWMKATGKIKDYDPNNPKHFLEQEEVKEDKDLEELKKLLTKNNSWYKISQGWYTVEVAAHTYNPSILRNILKKGNDDEVSWNAASNINCPSDALVDVLKMGNDNNVSYCAVSNPNCPPEMLVEILKRGNNHRVSCNAASNPNCPPKTLAEVLKRGKDDLVSYYASQNPNCPPLAMVLWMKATGRIKDYDPNNPKHFLEQEEVKEDKDLEELKKLISKNNSWYRTSQEWYTEEVATNTKDPNILRNILKRGNNDWVSYWAASNPNCPSDVLVEILKRNKDDKISHYAALNPNCPPELLAEILRRNHDNVISNCAAYNPSCPKEVLSEILKRGKDDRVSKYAASNPNCPPEALKDVLNRGNNDGVSWSAARNPNCPPLAMVLWMKATGKIKDYDPNNPKHFLEQEEVKEDKDLEELKKLISSNTSWYKISQQAQFEKSPFKPIPLHEKGGLEEGRKREEILCNAIKKLADIYNIGPINYLRIDGNGDINMLQTMQGGIDYVNPHEIPEELQKIAIQYTRDWRGISSRWIKLNHFAWEKMLGDMGLLPIAKVPIQDFIKDITKSSNKQKHIYSQTGEWWIIGSQAVFADADIGDMNHSGYVIESILSNHDLNPEVFDLTKETPESLRKKGLDEEEINVVLDKTDPRVYGIEKLGWKRVAGNNIQTQNLTEEDLKDIDYGLSDAYEQELEENEEIEFNIEVMSTNTFYRHIPFSVISTHNPMALREYGRVYAFNLSNHIKIAQIWNVVSDDLDDNLKALYELEYKRSMLLNNPFSGMPQRKDNILNNLGSKLGDVIGDLQRELSEGFSNWLSKHALLNAETWATERVDDLLESGMDSVINSMVDEYVRYAINHGRSSPYNQRQINDTFMQLIKEALKDVENFPSLKTLVDAGLSDYKSMLLDDLESEGLKVFGERWNKRFRNRKQAEDFINNLSIDDVDLESILYFENPSQFVHMLGDEVEFAKDMYRVFVFPHWLDYWSSMGIEETRENVENIYAKLTAISPNDIGNAIAVVNLAINATHQTGDMLDYIAEDTKYTKGLLDELTQGKYIEEWNKELREIGVQV